MGGRAAQILLNSLLFGRRFFPARGRTAETRPRLTPEEGNGAAAAAGSSSAAEEKRMDDSY
ncbi:Hypothetical predicted protein [Podarcis lilfordi]|uniref:Uncharacterized protein n=1 Tax=Podarcis lilfordi TaxID=74358 RepID=A0AA35JTE2_9SAUR|nr:Hypothetical predicted protein [Podarcis lilfordi]